VTETVLCSAQQPDKHTGQCILYCGHQGPHQTFVAEWNEGAAHSRRRQPHRPNTEFSAFHSTSQPESRPRGNRYNAFRVSEYPARQASMRAL